MITILENDDTIFNDNTIVENDKTILMKTIRLFWLLIQLDVLKNNGKWKNNNGQVEQ